MQFVFSFSEHISYCYYCCFFNRNLTLSNLRFVAPSYLTGAEKNPYQGHLVNIKQIADKMPKIKGTWYYYLAFIHISSLPKIIAVKRKFLRFLWVCQYQMNMRLVYVNEQTCFLKNFHTAPILQWSQLLLHW